MNISNQYLVFGALFCGLCGCGQHIASTQYESKSHDFTSIDFDSLLARVDSLNANELEYFHDNWPAVFTDLSNYSRSRRLNQLSRDQREQLWWSLEYLRGCRHGIILEQHGGEILEILYALDLPEQNNELRKILSDQQNVRSGDGTNESGMNTTK